MDVRVGLWRKLSAGKLMLLNCGVGEDSWESLRLQGDPTSQSKRKSVLNIHWKDWCWTWKLNSLATWYEELTHWKRPWCWERLKAREEGDDRGWDGWTASLTQWTWVWVNSGSWWWTGRPGVLQSMGSQRIRHNWATELKWRFQYPLSKTELKEVMLTPLRKAMTNLDSVLKSRDIILPTSRKSNPVTWNPTSIHDKNKQTFNRLKKEKFFNLIKGTWKTELILFFKMRLNASP